MELRLRVMMIMDVLGAVPHAEHGTVPIRDVPLPARRTHFRVVLRK